MITFVVDKNENKAKLYRNEMTNSISLTKGNVNIDWAGSDFIAKVNETASSTVALELVQTTFKIPFTFTLKDLIDKSLKLRFEFTKLGEYAGKAQVIDVYVTDLLAKLPEDVLEKLQTYIEKTKEYLQYSLLNN